MSRTAHAASADLRPRQSARAGLRNHLALPSCCGFEYRPVVGRPKMKERFDSSPG